MDSRIATQLLAGISRYIPSYRALAFDILLVLIVWIAVVFVQRAFLSPLCKIPGPFLNSFTNIQLIYSTMMGSYHTYSQGLHEKYGEVVRIGYNQVSVSNLAELKRILSTHDFRKGSLYENMNNMEDTVITTIPEVNKIRRRQLGNAYSMPCIRSYEDKILQHGVLSIISLWDSHLKRATDSGKKAQVSVNYYYDFHSISFDIIGVLGFGNSFNILPSGDTSIIGIVRHDLVREVVQSFIPLPEKLLHCLGIQTSSSSELLSITTKAILERMDSKETRNVDILQRLVDAHDPLSGKRMDVKTVAKDLALLLVVGTDTTSNTLSWTILYLLHNTAIYERLKKEVRSAFPDRGTIIRYDMARIMLPFMTAVIYESMRLHTIVSGYLPRRMPESGAEIMGGEYFVPPGSEICISLYACHRNPRIWKNPNKFDPERFMGPDAEDRIRDVLAFSSGVRICVGRWLALVELYTTLANLVHKYDFSLPSDIKGRYSSVDDIPGESFFSFSPNKPNRDCWMTVSPAT